MILQKTPRLRTWYREAGSKGGRPVLFIHGNASNSAIWKPILKELPHNIYALAPDLRMYGMSDPILKINSKRGVGDWAEDMQAFLMSKQTALRPSIHVVAHSLGALVALKMLANQVLPIDRLTLYASPPPHGYFTKGPDPSFVEALAQKDREYVTNVANTTFWHPSFRHPDLDQLVDAIFQMQVGPGAYPDAIIEAVSPARNVGLTSALLSLEQKPSITWVYGADDVLVANHGIGAPNERMIDDMRVFLQEYSDRGGSFEEIRYLVCGHSPFLEKPSEVERLMSTL